MRRVDPTRRTRTVFLAASVCTAVLLAAIVIVLTLRAGSGSRTSAPADAALPADAPTLDMVLVYVGESRLVGETAEGDFVTIELDSKGQDRVAAAAHAFTHASAAQPVRVAYATRGERRFALGLEAGPEDFPGVSRTAPRDMTGAEYDGIRIGASRSSILDNVGPPHVPGIGTSEDGPPVDCFTWHAARKATDYRLCFDQTSAPRLVTKTRVRTR